MINEIKKLSSNASLGKKEGRFLSDKSYGFDTVYFIAKLIYHKQENNCFYRSELRKLSVPYIEDVFQLKKGTKGAVNYFVETINFLEFSNLITKVDNNKYKINDTGILDYIIAAPENAYIFIYTVVIQTFINDKLYGLFKNYCLTNNRDEKSQIVKQIYDKFQRLSISIEKTNTNWSKQLVHYALNVLGYVNHQYQVTRMLNVKSEKLNIKDISLNVEGTRTPKDKPKKADYLENFNYDYVVWSLKDELVVPQTYNKDNISTTDNIATGLADLKLSLLDLQNQEDLSDAEKSQYIEGEVRQRNQAVQRQFRNELLKNNAHCCPVCGYSFEPFLIASHIKPYSKCTDTYDAINQFNGFLMCPNHDKLFEDAKHMTIDYQTGEIRLSKEAKSSKDYSELDGKHIAKAYIDNERRHYLKWHNDRFQHHYDYATGEF